MENILPRAGLESVLFVVAIPGLMCWPLYHPDSLMQPPYLCLAAYNNVAMLHNLDCFIKLVEMTSFWYFIMAYAKGTS